MNYKADLVNYKTESGQLISVNPRYVERVEPCRDKMQGWFFLVLASGATYYVTTRYGTPGRVTGEQGPEHVADTLSAKNRRG